MPKGKHPNSIAALKRTAVKPGEVRNPLGINRKRPFSDRYHETSEAEFPEVLRKKFNRRWKAEVLKPGATYAQAVVIRQNLEAAMLGITRAAKEAADRIEGKPPQRLEISTPQKAEITVRIIHDRKKQSTG